MVKTEKGNYLTSSQIDSFRKEGYLLIKRLYAKENITKIRNIIENGRKSGKWKESIYNNDSVTADIYALFPELIDLIFTEGYIHVMKELLGEDCVLIPEPAIHRNRYYYWHKDSSYLDSSGETFHLNEDFLAVQTAIYMQANHSKHGGGLSIIPKSQHNPDNFSKLEALSKMGRGVLKLKRMLGISYYDKLDRDKNLINIKSEAGDLIVFNYKIDHKGTENKKNELTHDKYAIFNLFINQPKYTEDIKRGLRNNDWSYSKNYLSSKNFSLPKLLLEKGKQLDITIDL